MLAGAVASCGGGGGNADAGDPAATLPELPARRASAATPVAAGCNGGSVSGTNYANAEVEPYAAVNPGNANHLLATWQQDRWSDGGARALVSAVSLDGGATWQRTLQAMSRCGGAVPGSAGDVERVSDPWVDFGPDGTAHAMGLGLIGAALQPGSASAMLASCSIDGGRKWSPVATLARDGTAYFHDKNSLTADPTDARLVYAVWDRLDPAGNGPTLLARSVDAGVSWQPARVIYAPTSSGVSQTLGNRIVVLAAGAERGTLVNVFNQIDTVAGTSSSRIGVVRSGDQGTTWSAPVFVADLRAVGARNPEGGQLIRDGALLPSMAAGPDGSLWVAWQDARFSAGMRDAIALARSTDGGRTWSAPVAINRVPGAAAFTPALHVRADGLVGVMHYDLRSNTPDPSTLLADAWLLTSRDGVSWSETRVHGPFDMAAAPDARGLFLGDYQGLVSSGSAFVPVLALSRTNTANRTDIFAPRLEGLSAGREAPQALHRARAAVPAPADPARLSALRSQAIAAVMEQRVPGWRARVQAGMPQR